MSVEKTRIQRTKAFLQNRRLAWLITILVIVAASIFGTGKSLKTMRRETVNIFESGADGTGKGITYEVKQIQDNCWNFLAVGEKYLSAGEDELKAVESCCTALSNANTPGDIYKNVQSLLEAIDNLYQKLESSSMDETDENYMNKLYTNIQSSFKVSQMSVYNERATDFNQVLKTIPARVINQLIGVKPLELYE